MVESGTGDDHSVDPMHGVGAAPGVPGEETVLDQEESIEVQYNGGSQEQVSGSGYTNAGASSKTEKQGAFQQMVESGTGDDQFVDPMHGVGALPGSLGEDTVLNQEESMEVQYDGGSEERASGGGGDSTNADASPRPASATGTAAEKTEPSTPW